MTMHDDDDACLQSEGITPEFKELEHLKFSPSTKSDTADKSKTKNSRSNCRMLSSL